VGAKTIEVEACVTTYFCFCKLHQLWTMTGRAGQAAHCGQPFVDDPLEHKQK